MIILGDVGFNVFGDARDCYNKYHINSLGFTVFCVNGNHKMRPYDIKTYKMKEYNSGLVWYENEFPNLLFAKDGEVYDLGGMKCMVIGGAYSIDKPIRIAMGYPWFGNEQPSSEIKCFVEQRLSQRDNKIDVILSHTCPLKYESSEVFLSGIDQSTVDKSTEKWFDRIEETIGYKKWFCGHYHTSKKIDKIQFMFEEFLELS